MDQRAGSPLDALAGSQCYGYFTKVESVSDRFGSGVDGAGGDVEGLWGIGLVGLVGGDAGAEAGGEGGDFLADFLHYALGKLQAAVGVGVGIVFQFFLLAGEGAGGVVDEGEA